MWSIREEARRDAGFRPLRLLTLRRMTLSVDLIANLRARKHLIHAVFRELRDSPVEGVSRPAPQGGHSRDL
jgi:hypothetical protein